MTDPTTPTDDKTIERVREIAAKMRDCIGSACVHCITAALKESEPDLSRRYSAGKMQQQVIALRARAEKAEAKVEMLKTGLQMDIEKLKTYLAVDALEQERDTALARVRELDVENESVGKRHDWAFERIRALEAGIRDALGYESSRRMRACLRALLADPPAPSPSEPRYTATIAHDHWCPVTVGGLCTCGAEPRE